MNPEQMTPQQIEAVLRARRAKLMRLDPQDRDRFLESAFNYLHGQTLRRSGLTYDEMKTATKQWISGILGEKPQPLPASFGVRPTPQPGAWSYPASFAAGVGAGLAQQVHNLLSLAGLPGAKATGKVAQTARYAGGVHPWVEPAGELGSYLIPGTPAARAASSAAEIGELLPEAGRLATLGRAAITGALTAPTFTDKPSHIPAMAALGAGGELIGPAIASKFPILGRLLRWSARGKTVPEAEVKAAATEVKSSVPQELQDFVKSKYGKMFEELSAPQQDAATTEYFRSIGVRIPTKVARDSIAQEQFGKPYSDLDDVQKSVVRKAVRAQAKKVPPVVSEAVKENKQAVAAAQTASKIATGRIPPGVSGVSPQAKELLDKIDEITQKIESAKSPLAKAQLQKTLDNLSKALQGDKEALQRLKGAERVSRMRAKAAEAKPPSEVGFTEAGPTPIASEETPNVELIDTLKGLKVEGINMQELHDFFTGLEKRGADPAEVREYLHDTYKRLASRLGIKDVEDKSLGDLYKEITIKSPPARLAVGPGSAEKFQSFPGDIKRIIKLSGVGHIFMSKGGLTSNEYSAVRPIGFNLSREFWGQVLDFSKGNVDLAKQNASEYLQKYLGLDEGLASKIADVLPSEDVAVVSPEAGMDTYLHEALHSLVERNKDKLPKGSYPELAEDMATEIYGPEALKNPQVREEVTQWGENPEELATESMAQVALRKVLLKRGIRAVSKDSTTYKIAMFFIDEMKHEPAIRIIAKNALGLALAVAGGLGYGSTDLRSADDRTGRTGIPRRL